MGIEHCELKIPVTGMTCGGCEKAVTRSLSQMAGVTRATASHIDGIVEVTFDPSIVAPDAIRGTIEALGYVVGT